MKAGWTYERYFCAATSGGNPVYRLFEMAEGEEERTRESPHTCRVFDEGNSLSYVVRMEKVMVWHGKR
ncbi:hypothetical protein JL36_06035 [Lactococcus cremoris]|nr:hypothetical protein JL36_06035 [Lactococcus cremoris]